MSTPKTHSKASAFFLGAWHRWWVKTLLILVIIFVVIRLILSPVATKVANYYLGKKIPHYYGHVNCIHFAFIRGAYKIDSLYLNKIDSATQEQTPFVSVKMVDLSVQWGAILHGKLVGELDVRSPVVKFTKDKVEPKTVVKDTNTFRKMLDVGMPLDINRFEIHDGSVRYADLTSTPKVDISMKKIEVLVENLRSVEKKGEGQLPGSVKASADVYGGTVSLNMKLNVLKDDPTFDLQAEVKHLELPKLNEFFKAYGKFDVSTGDFSVYSEVAAKEGAFKGYVKPLIKDLKIGDFKEKESALQRLWEGILDAAAWILKNKKEDQLATKIPLEGSFKNPKPDLLYTIFELLRNGFISALNPALDYEININSVGKVDDRKASEKFGDKLKGRKESKAETRKEAKAEGKKDADKKEKKDDEKKEKHKHHKKEKEG